MRLIACVAFGLVFGFSACAGVGVVFRQSELSLSFDAAARVSSLKGADGRELVESPVPFAELTAEAGAKAVAATAVERTADGALAFRFGSAGAAVLAVEPFDGGWTFRVVSVEPATAERLTLGCVRPVCVKYRGTFANVMSDDASFVAVRGYEADSAMSIASGRMSVAYTREHGLVGKRFGLAAGGRPRAVPALRAMTVAAGVPRTVLGGAWSLGAEGNRSSYFFQYHNSTNNEALVDLARRVGTTTINLYDWWHRLGRYEVNPDYYHGGYPDFTNTVAYLKRAGFKVSLHTLTGCIDPADPWISPEPSDGLVVDATYSLAAPLSADATELTVGECPIKGHDLVFTYACNGNVLKVGKELIQYSGVRREKPYGFTGLKRGAFGTRAAAHPSAARCDYLHQRYLAFYPDPDGPLADAVTAAIAGTFNAVQADQIYFDGSEGMGKPYAVAAMRRKIFAALDQSGHPVLDEASCPGANNWWFHSRLGAWDSCDWAAKRFHDLHHERTIVQARQAEFLEPQMGWWYPKKYTKNARGHFLDEDEYFASRNAGADAAMSILGVDLVNGPIPSGQLSLVTVIGWYERIRLARAFAPGVQARFAKPRAEFRLRQGADGVWTVRDAFVRPHRAAGEATVRWRESFAADLPAALRVEALFGAAPYDSSEAVTALAAIDVPSMEKTSAPKVTVACTAVRDAVRGEVLSLKAENRGDSPRGAWAGVKKAFPFPYRDFGDRGALGAWVKGDGSGALLNLQVETPREYHGAYSEHYLRLDFTGWKYVTFLLRERDAATYPDFVWPYGGKLYPHVGRNQTDMKHVSGVNVWLNEVPPGGKTEISLSDVKFLGVTERTVEGASVTVNGQAFALPFALASGDYAELEGGVWTRYDRFGEPLARGRTEVPRVKASANAFSFASASPDDRVEVTVTALGSTAPALLPNLTDAMKREMAYEYEMPVRYCPSAGFDGHGQLAIRPQERACVVARTHGAPKGARLVLRQGDNLHEVVLPGETPPLSGCWTYFVEGGTVSADFRLEISKRYENEER